MSGFAAVWFWFLLPFAAVGMFVLTKTSAAALKQGGRPALLSRRATLVVLVVIGVAIGLFWIDRRVEYTPLSGTVISLNPDVSNRNPDRWLCTIRVNDGVTITDNCTHVKLGESVLVCRTQRLLSRIASYALSSC